MDFRKKERVYASEQAVSTPRANLMTTRSVEFFLFYPSLKLTQELYRIANKMYKFLFDSLHRIIAPYANENISLSIWWNNWIAENFSLIIRCQIIRKSIAEAWDWQKFWVLNSFVIVSAKMLRIFGFSHLQEFSHIAIYFLATKKIRDNWMKDSIIQYCMLNIT